MFLKFKIYTLILIMLSGFFAWTELSIEQLQKAAKMMTAINEGDLERVKELLESGEYDDLSASDINDGTGITYLHYAASSRRAEMTGNQADIMQAFLDKGADVNAQDQWGNSPLHEVSFVESAEALINAGANVKAKNEKGEIPLHRVGSPELAALYIGEGMDVNARDKEGKTPLYEVFKPELAELYIRNGGDLNVRDNKGRNPLHSVFSAETAEVYIRAGGDVNARDEEGKPLRMAAGVL